jgi:trimethyllysine dioxygenase
MVYNKKNKVKLPELKYWSSTTDIPTLDYQHVMESSSGLKDWLNCLLAFGISFIKNVPVNKIASKQLAERICFIRHTHYGGFWEFTADLAHHDTAYTNMALPPHTDTTYLTDPVGLQFFHLLEHNGTGGQGLYVDGFHAAQILLQKHKWAFDILVETKLSAHAAGDDNTLLQPSKKFSIINLLG